MNRTKLLFAVMISAAIFTSCKRSYTCYCMSLTDYQIASVTDMGEQKRRSDAKAACATKETTPELQCTLENPHIAK